MSVVSKVPDQLDLRAREIVSSLHGRWTRGRGMCLCPAHEDRTPSLSVTLGRTAILFHCFAGCTTAAVLAALARRGVATGSLFDGGPSGKRPARNASSQTDNVQRLWREAACIKDTPAERYLGRRGISVSSPDLRYLARTPLGPSGQVRFIAAMIAAVRTDLGVQALHRTFLNARSGRPASIEGPKRALGSLGHGAVRLWGPRGGKLGLAEGIETAMSACQLFGIPCWAALGAERFGLVAIPESVRELTLFVDHDAGGRLAEERARAAYSVPGRTIVVERPGKVGADWNDVLIAGEAGLR